MEVMNDLQKLREKAVAYYLARDFYCSESVLKVIHESFNNDLPEDIIALASGFPHGVGGSGCICGALVGGSMALGMFFGRSEAKDDEKVKKTMELSHELHNIFKERHKVTCCRVLSKNVTHGTPEHLQQCANLAGEVTEETAKIIIREKGADILKR